MQAQGLPRFVKYQGVDVAEDFALADDDNQCAPTPQRDDGNKQESADFDDR